MTQNKHFPEGKLTDMISVSITAKAAWRAPLTMAATHPTAMYFHSGAFIRSNRVIDTSLKSCNGSSMLQCDRFSMPQTPTHQHSKDSPPLSQERSNSCSVANH